MYRILLADDEPLVIQSMIKLFERKYGDLCKIESASTGRKVIELAEVFRPDIVVMDIQMPGINGIDAIATMKEKGVGAYYVVMSAYDKFDYAKRAIEMGVIDFLTKPCNATKIVATIDHVMGLVDQDRKRLQIELEVKEKLDTILPMLESGLIYTILFQDDYRDEAGNYKQLLGVLEENGFLMVLEYGDSEKAGKLTNPVGAAFKAERNAREIREVIKEFFPALVGPPMANKLVILVPVLRKGKLTYDERVKQIEQANRMVQKLKEKTEVSYRLGIGSVHELSELHESYREAHKAMRYISNEVAHIMDILPEEQIEENYPVEIEREIFAKLKQGDKAEVLASADRFFHWMTTYHEDCILDIKLKVLELTMTIERMALESGKLTYHFRDRKDYLSQVMAFDQYHQLHQWFRDKIEMACAEVVLEKKEKYSSTVQKAMNYLEEHYAEDISLEAISEIVDVSPYYFGRIFREEVSEGYVEYLTNLRMKIGKKMLDEDICSIKEICSTIGYSDPSYFTRIFKKTFGVTPTIYRSSRMGGEVE